MLPYGMCREQCDLRSDPICDDPDGTCVPGDIIGAVADACLDVPRPYLDPSAVCGIPDHDELDPCGPTRLCLSDLSVSGTTCIDVCRRSVGELGTSQHPDCTNSDAVCTEIEPGLPYGRCL
jgi:hypothetical protein